MARLKYTKDEIDERLALIGNVSNPNLLDNWYFANPVNQRGQTEYSGRIYCVDRWRHNNANITTNVTDDGLRISYDGEFATVLERIEDSTAKELRGKQLTLSILVKSVESGAIRFQIYDNISRSFQTNWIESAGLASVTFTLPDDYAVAFCRIQSRNAGTIATVNAVKLEFGAQQTLAHQENGVWVLNEIPNYGEELRKCQRYCQVFNYQSENYAQGYGVVSSTTNINASIPLAVPMRAIPTINDTAGSNWVVRSNGSVLNCSSVSVWYASGTSLGLKFAVDGAATSQSAIVNSHTGTLLVLSADL